MRPNPVLSDPYIKVEVLAATPNPQRLIWQAMHQDYSEEFVFIEPTPDETGSGENAVKHLLDNKRGHFGPLEHPQITFAVGFFPHSVMQQARTHRIGCSFDVQSMRYTGNRICSLQIPENETFDDVEKVFYIRPVGTYHDRKGRNYEVTEYDREEDLEVCYFSAVDYAKKIAKGYSEEHARSLLPFDFRQHFVVSFTLRAALHFLDLRAKADAQDEIRALCDLMWPHIEEWVPEIAKWYQENRFGKALLSP